MDKKTLRQSVLKQRKAMTHLEHQQKSQQIYRQILEQGLLDPVTTLLIYMDYRNEVATKPIIQEAFKRSIRVVLPVVDFDTMTLQLVSIENLDTDMRLSQYNILEPIPTAKNRVDLHEIDLILAPGVAFDQNLYRLGYGGGFYDKLLADKNPKTPVYALAFELQMVHQVPYEPYDYQMDGILTERSFYQ